MAHFSEMDFLFINTPNSLTEATKNIQNTVSNNAKSIYDSKKSDGEKVYVYKGPWGDSPKLKGENEKTQLPNEIDSGTKPNFENIKNYTKTTIYDTSVGNPYVDLINNFNGENSSKSLMIKASDLAYLRYLGVYPINRMVVLRRFHSGMSVPEKLDELDVEPISTIVGWLKEDDDFGKISFNEDWTRTTKRLDELFANLIKSEFNQGKNIKNIMPVPGFARGLLFELLKAGGLTNDWSWDNIPIGDPDVLQEGPYRDPAQQNIKSTFNFNFETTYEQKFIGDVDPGSAMIDIIDNILKMGTSNMKYWLNGESGIIKNAMSDASPDSVYFWWEMVKNVVTEFGNVVVRMVKGLVNTVKDVFSGSASDAFRKGKELLIKTLKMILVSTVSKYRWELRGSLEMMTGTISTTPWYLTIGNPYSPWLATNHIIVRNIEISTSNEVGFNDMPMWLNITLNLEQSRNLGRNEIIRMFNNSFLREYTKPISAQVPEKLKQDLNNFDRAGSKSSDEEKQKNNNEKDQNEAIPIESIESSGPFNFLNNSNIIRR